MCVCGGGLIVKIGITFVWWKGLNVLYVQSSWFNTIIVAELGFFWVAKQDHFTAFGASTIFMMCVRPLPLRWWE